MTAPLLPAADVSGPPRRLRADRVDDRARAAAGRRARHHAGPRRLLVAGHDQRPGAVRRAPVFAVGHARRAGAAGAQRAGADGRARRQPVDWLRQSRRRQPVPQRADRALLGARRPAARRDRGADRGSPRHRLGGRRRRAVEIRGRSVGTDGRRGRSAGDRGLHASTRISAARSGLAAPRACIRRETTTFELVDGSARRTPGASAKTEPARSG